MAKAEPIFALLAGLGALIGLAGANTGVLTPMTGFTTFVGSALLGGVVTVLLSIGTWQRANYTITGARAGTGAEPQVVVTLPADVASPLAVRYPYEAWPQCSFYNGRGGPDDHAGIAANPWCWNHTTPCPY